jgi:hypothetical protein
MLWAGFAPSDAAEFSRPVELPGGTREARFRVSMASLERTPGGRAFVCEHLTRDLVWRPEYVRHANGALEIAAVAIVAGDVAAAARPYEHLLAATAEPIAEGLVVRTGRAAIAFALAARLAARLPGAGMSPRPAPFMAALFVRVADREAAAAALAAGGLPHARMPDGSIALGADVVHGVTLVFG